MTRHSKRRSKRAVAAALVTGGLAVGVLGATLGGPASAEVPRRAPSQIATPPPPGNGVVIVVETPQPLGPVSFT